MDKYRINNEVVMVQKLESNVTNKKNKNISITNGTVTGQIKIEDGIIKMNPPVQQEVI